MLSALAGQLSAPLPFSAGTVRVTNDIYPDLQSIVLLLAHGDSQAWCEGQRDRGTGRHSRPFSSLEVIIRDRYALR